MMIASRRGQAHWPMLPAAVFIGSTIERLPNRRRPLSLRTCSAWRTSLFAQTSETVPGSNNIVIKRKQSATPLGHNLELDMLKYQRKSTDGGRHDMSIVNMEVDETGG